MSGLARLPGLGDRNATIALWQRCAGRQLDTMEWYDVYVSWKLTMISERALAVYAASGHTLADIAAGERNPNMIRLERLLAAGS